MSARFKAGASLTEHRHPAHHLDQLVVVHMGKLRALHHPPTRGDQVQALGDGPGCGRLISGDHQGPHTGCPEAGDGLGHLGGRRIHETDEPEEREILQGLLGTGLGRRHTARRHRKHTQTFRGEALVHTG